MSASTISVDRQTFLQMRTALTIANRVLEKNRLSGMDQNPMGVRDLVFSAAFAADRVIEREGK